MPGGNGKELNTTVNTILTSSNHSKPSSVELSGEVSPTPSAANIAVAAPVASGFSTVPSADAKNDSPAARGASPNQAQPAYAAGQGGPAPFVPGQGQQGQGQGQGGVGFSASLPSSTLPPAAPIMDVHEAPILPQRLAQPAYESDGPRHSTHRSSYNGVPYPGAHESMAKRREWLMSMNAMLENTPIGQVDPNQLPLSTIMNGWAKQKSSEGARMVELWLDRVHSEYNAENPQVHPTARMYTMAVDAWAKSNGGAPAARRAEALLERMDRLYREGGGRHEALKPTTGIFNAVINVSIGYDSSVALFLLLAHFYFIFRILLHFFVIRPGPAPARRSPRPGPSRYWPGWRSSATRAGTT